MNFLFVDSVKSIYLFNKESIGMRIRLTPPNWPTSFRPASRSQNCWLIERVERNWPIGFCVKTDTREDKEIRIDLVIYSLVRSAAKERKKQKIGKSCQNWSSPMSFFVHFLFGSFTLLQSWPIFWGFRPVCVCLLADDDHLRPAGSTLFLGRIRQDKSGH
jgi:hypothetical protein